MFEQHIVLTGLLDARVLSPVDHGFPGNFPAIFRHRQLAETEPSQIGTMRPKRRNPSKYRTT